MNRQELNNSRPRRDEVLERLTDFAKYVGDLHHQAQGNCPCGNAWE